MHMLEAEQRITHQTQKGMRAPCPQVRGHTLRHPCLDQQVVYDCLSPDPSFIEIHPRECNFLLKNEIKETIIS